METLKCDYCGKEKAEISFFIGASLQPDWTVIEGTGKVTCPDCWNIAKEDGKKAIENHIQWVKKRVRENE